MVSFTVQYVTTKGSVYTDDDAAVIGPELESIERRCEGVNANIVIAEAQDSSSPLHQYFDWDDGVAGPKWRKEQARKMLQAIKVKRVNGEESRPVRAFLPVHVQPNLEDQSPHEKPVVRYVSLDRIKVDPEKIEEVMQRARNELFSFQRKYEDFIEEFFEHDPRLGAVLEKIESMRQENEGEEE